MGRPAREGESPVLGMMNASWDIFLSTARPEKPCRKLGRPRSKAKYDAATDSAEVP
jgi:hypothetical protein